MNHNDKIGKSNHCNKRKDIENEELIVQGIKMPIRKYEENVKTDLDVMKNQLNLSKGSKKQKIRKGKKKMKLNKFDSLGDSDRIWPKRLLVLDMNGVLVCRRKKSHAQYNHNFQDPKGYFIYDRPQMRQFLDWILNKRGFTVALWTSASDEVAEAMSHHVFAKPKFDADKDCLFVWSGSKCLGKNRVKPLSKVWEEFGAQGWNADNTLILDNSPFKAHQNSKNLIQIETFDLESYVPDKDPFGSNGKIFSYLDALQRYEGSVQKWVEEHQYEVPLPVTFEPKPEALVATKPTTVEETPSQKWCAVM